MKHLLCIFLFGFLAFAWTNSAYGQQKKKVEILNTDASYYDADLMDADRLIGNVRLRYNEVLMFCDSAYRYPDGNFDAFSRIRINQGDSIVLLGDRLFVDNSTKQAKLRENIRFKDKDLTLTTELLNYDLETGVASYFEGGKIVSTENNNVLTSDEGFYDYESEFFHFRNNVELKNPEYTVLSDTLKYNGTSETAYFFGPTTIKSDQNTIFCNNGWYSTKTEVCQFNEGARIFSKSTFLEGDSIYYEGGTGYGEVFGNVMIQDTTSNYFITGDYGWHHEENNKSLVTGNAEMVQFFEGDSLFLHADTLRAAPDSLGKNLITAYQHVKIFKNDLQGVSDSLTYLEADSLLTLYGNPLLWSKDNQISGEKIEIKLFNGKIDQMIITSKAMIVSEAVEGRYNQIKGRNLVGYFYDNKLRKIFVKGNGQTIYFPTEEGEVKEVIGVNRADCSDVNIFVNESVIERIVLINKPSGALHPMSKAEQDDLFLEGFFWNAENRPEKREDIFYWQETVMPE